jgi:hypothetical protein
VTTPRPWLSLLQDLYTPPSPEQTRRETEEYGKLLVDLGLATREQIDRCLLAPADPAKPFPKLSQLLIQRRILSPAQLASSVVAQAAEDPDNRIGAYVLVGNLRGETWKAWDTVRRDWAELTFIPPKDVDFLRRRSAVVHPSLAAVLSIGTSHDRTYVACEAIAGVRLSSAPRSEPRQLIAAVRDASEGAAALHAQDLEHGAITVERVTIDGAGRGRLTGWGGGSGDVRALGAALYEVLSDRPAPAKGTPKTWPKRLSKELRAVLEEALGYRRYTAAAFAEGLSGVLKGS